MITKAAVAAERTGFSARLVIALKAAGYHPSPSFFAREFNLRTLDSKVTVHAARKWLIGQAIPTQERISLLGRWLNVSAHWLRFGEGASDDIAPGRIIAQDEEKLLLNFRGLDERAQGVLFDLIDLLRLPRAMSG
jgi:hypothetical protein